MTRNARLLSQLSDLVYQLGPEAWDQGTWYRPSENGRAIACTAGWALLLNEWTGYNPRPSSPVWFSNNRTPALTSRVYTPGDAPTIESTAAELLGLTTEEATILFHHQWEPAGDPTIPRHHRAAYAFTALANGAHIEAVTA